MGSNQVFAPLPIRRHWVSSTSLSAGAHAVAALALFFGLRTHPVHVFTLPGTQSGTRVELAYMPGRAPAPALQPKKVKPRVTPTRAVTPLPAVANAAPAPRVKTAVKYGAPGAGVRKGWPTQAFL